MSKRKLFIILLAAAFPSVSSANYCTTGKVEGSVCEGLFIKSCKFIQVDATKDEDGNLISVNGCYRDVSEYNKEKGRCWISMESGARHTPSWLSGLLSQQQFFHKNKNGRYEEVEVEYLTFKCFRR